MEYATQKVPVKLSPVLQILKVSGKYLMGLACLKPSGSITFKTDLPRKHLNITWKDTPLFDEYITLGKVYRPVPGAALGRYHFGIDGEVGFPRFIELCDGNSHSNDVVFRLYKEKSGPLDIRVSVSVPFDSQWVNFKVGDEFDGKAELCELPQENPIYKFSRNKGTLAWNPGKHSQGKVLVKVLPKNTKGVLQVGGGNEAEIEIEPPHHHSSFRSNPTRGQQVQESVCY